MLIHAIFAWEKKSIEGDEEEYDRPSSCERAKERVGHNHADENAAEQHQHHRQSRLPRLLADRMSGPFIWCFECGHENRKWYPTRRAIYLLAA